MVPCIWTIVRNLSGGLDDLNGRWETPRTLRRVARKIVKLAPCGHSLDTNTTNMTEFGQYIYCFFGYM